MKNFPYNTGRTVTINLDTLGNADIWQIYQILTDSTGYVFQGDDPDAAPRADSDAAMEVFFHIAHTAKDRADGADSFQKEWLEGILEEYLEVFGEDEDEDEDEELLDQAEQDDARTGTELYADMAVQAFLDSHDARNIDAALRANGEDLSKDPNNIYRAGAFAGLAEAAAWMIYNTAELDDIHAITAAIYRAYGVKY